MTEAERSAVGAVAGIAHRTLAQLTPQFLALLLVNAVLIFGLFWFLDSHAARRTEAMQAVLTACIRSR